MFAVNLQIICQLKTIQAFIENYASTLISAETSRITVVISQNLSKCKYCPLLHQNRDYFVKNILPG